MTDDERMERAERIRRMRQGLREDDPDAAGGETGSTDETGETDMADETGDAGTADGTVESGAQSDESAADSNLDDGESDASVASSDDSAAEDTGSDTDDGAADTLATDDAESMSDEAEAADAESMNDEAETGDSAKVNAEVSEAVESTSGARAELPDAETMEAALENTDAEGGLDAGGEEPAGPAAGIAGEEVESTQEADTRVLEFTLGDEQYGLDIEYIEEIVKHDNITRVPNTPDFVEGVVDLRGQITTILNPKVTIGKADTTRGDLIVVFDSEAFDDQHIGWVVDDVRQVSPVHDEQVNDPPMEEDYINGVIDRDDDEQFVIWTTPDLALEEAN